MLTEIDPVLLIEFVVVLIIFISQLIVFGNIKSSISKLKKIFPAGHKLDIEFLPTKAGESEASNDEEDADTGKVTLIKNDSKFSQVFQEIVESTNNYILRNKGGVSYSGIENIAERKGKALESSIEQVIAMPLYLGLLGTFTGVIIGLVKIAVVGVSDPAIQTFIGGVLVGMIASAFGLYLTVRNNSLFKNAKKSRDRDLYDYLNFVRMNIIPRSPRFMPDELKKLQYNIAAFTDEFVNYQKHLNNTLTDSLQRFEDLETVFANIKGLEPGLQNIRQFLQSNNTLMERQVSNLEAVNQRTSMLTQTIGDRMQQVDDRLRMIERGPVSSDSGFGGGGVAVATDEYVRVQKALLEKMENTETASQQMANQVTNLYNFLQNALPGVDNERNFLNSFGFKLFTFLGSVAFLIGIVAGLWYIINDIMPLYM